VPPMPTADPRDERTHEKPNSNGSSATR
jgi:hypothetical protein